MFLPFALALLAGSAPAQLTPAWVVAGPSTVARIVIEDGASCPEIQTGSRRLPMAVRQPVPHGFKPVCEAVIPPGARQASIGGQRLALPKKDPKNIVVIGDTGCRLEGDRIQACNDPSKWPFEAVANRAAAGKPDLILDVGDYLYREEACPAGKEALCAGSPHGDNWITWNADFFKPAAKLLAAAPWVMSRGNHEDCNRAWRGFGYYLDPRPWDGKCQVFTEPYVVKLGRFEVAALDSSGLTADRAVPDQVKTFTAQLKSLRVKNAWLIDHHPFWSFAPDRSGKKLTALSPPLQQAWDNAKPSGISLVLSGHTHLFEILSFESGRPPQIVAGDGGTQLAAALPGELTGQKIQGAAVIAAESKHEFGFVRMTKAGAGWQVRLLGQTGEAMVSCRIQGNSLNCPAAQSRPSANPTD